MRLFPPSLTCKHTCSFRPSCLILPLLFSIIAHANFDGQWKMRTLISSIVHTSSRGQLLKKAKVKLDNKITTILLSFKEIVLALCCLSLCCLELTCRALPGVPLWCHHQVSFTRLSSQEQRTLVDDNTTASLPMHTNSTQGEGRTEERGGRREWGGDRRR